MRRALWTLAVLLSHWRRHPMQLAMLMIGLISATALWSGVQALNQQARQSYDRAAAALGGAHVTTLVSRDGTTIPQTLYIALRRGGWVVSPVLEGRVQVGHRSLRLIGIDPVTLPAKATASPALSRNDFAAFIAPPGEALIAPETLAELHLAGNATPETTRGKRLPPLKRAPELAPGVLIVDIGVAQNLLGLPGELSRLMLADIVLRDQKPLQAIAGNRLRLVAPQAETDLERLTDSFHLNLTAFGLLSFLVGLFIVNAAIGLAYEQRLPTLRTLRTCGVSARMLNAVLLAELISLALAAGLVGLACGYAVAASLLPNVAATLRGLYGAELPGVLTLRPGWALAGLAMSIAGALAAAATSAFKSFRLPILAAAQPHAWHQAQRRWLRTQGMVALLFIAAALLMAQFGNSLISGFAVLAALMLAAALLLPLALSGLLAAGGRLAQQPIAQWFFADGRQQLSALSLALMALLLALAVNVGVATMVQSFSRTFTTWLDGRLSADVFLNLPDREQAEAVKAWLAQRSEVEAIMPGARADIRFRDMPAELLGVPDDPLYRSRWPLLEADGDAWKLVGAGSGAMVSEQLARRLGISRGDELGLPTPKGAWRVRVMAIYADYGNPRGQIAVTTNALLAHFPDTPQTRFGLRVAKDKVAPLIDALRARFRLGDRELTDQASLKASSTAIFNRTFAVTSALNAFTLGIAGVALLTSLLTLGNSRLPQLAPLWAIGLPRRTLAMIELLKTLAVALLTALLALPLGLVVAWLLIAVVNVKAFGWRLPFQVFPLQMIELVGVAMLAAFVAALIPFLRLLRTQPAALAKVFADER